MAAARFVQTRDSDKVHCGVDKSAQDINARLLRPIAVELRGLGRS